MRLANKVGYDPRGLERFLHRLSDRNKAATEKQGLFASHPEMKERLDLLAKQVTAEKLASTATLEAALPQVHHLQGEGADRRSPPSRRARPGWRAAASRTDQEEKKEEQPKKKGFGLGSLLKPTGSESKSAEVTGSGASRGVDTERNAKGGRNPAIVVVKVTIGRHRRLQERGKPQVGP